MADPLHLKRLRDSVDKSTGRKDWLLFKLRAKWIDLSTADLSALKLRDYDLSELNMSTAIFRGAELINCDLSDSILSFSDFRRANLRNSCFDRADLRSANLQEAEMVDTCLEGANLSQARLSGCNLVGADLSGSNLTEADLRGAVLKFARLTGAVVDGADVTDADLTGAVLDDEAPAQMLNFQSAIIDDRKYREMRCRLIGEKRPRVIADPDQILRGEQPAAPTEEEEDRIEHTHQIPLRAVEPDLTTAEGCCAVLEIEPGAGHEEITRAFRRKAKLFHPDKVRHLRPRLQELAGEEFMRLRKAYEFLTRRATTRKIARNIHWPPGMERNRSPYDYSIGEYEALAALNGDNADILYNLAWKYFEAGRMAEAWRGFERVLSINPNDDDAHYNLMIIRLYRELLQIPVELT
ncbi:MAG TPA: pentapeptide repeat-containing protein [Candidatus Sumerlaeota bacterium]|nr:MAG: Secreted effector protein pipB2 [candidate division BRC1 bacterium ADurb.BinA292]HOE95172.1 pentapeptide repeat-containing protein [Candidatus Sumerlaeota bacterium]HOR28049.1 pentapeptide repeat-containing protein [Candidatus Sumerlaeota bacterium]HPK01115.1 pentapeptide repeat-containing protein [Candidatus Sumerlaeota bacterium]